MGSVTSQVQGWALKPGHGCACDLCHEDEVVLLVPKKREPEEKVMERQEAVFGRELPCY